jgi:uncharacterized membrane protein
MELWQTLGNLHPKLVQFPLVLLLAGLIFDALGLIRRDRRFNWAGGILSAAGTVFLLVAFICGIYAEIWAGRAGVPQDPIEWHEFLANVASWGFVVLMAWRVLIPLDRPRMLATYTTIGLAYYFLLFLTAYFGGQLVFSYGAAVVGGQANTVLSLHDLNVLATRQTDENLKYSELMHHIFGWLTLALSGSLLANAMFPAKSAKLRWGGPTLLLVGGVFLFFFADLDLYRLLDPRQLRDREVQLHKTIAIIMTVVGVMGLKRKETPQDQTPVPLPNDEPPLPTPGLRYSEDPDRPPTTLPPPQPPTPTARAPQLVALMALIGGGLLFTHVHTVAPYANVAAGVYVQHMVMGTIALSIGAARLLQDVWPRRRNVQAVAFAGLMCAESVLLITYNEGLPWYLGYGSYNRWGPHGGTIAPLGATRAELTYDNANQKLDIYLLDRFKDQPSLAPISDVSLLIARGYSEVAVPLAASGDAADAHYAAAAPWMKDTATFSARMSLLDQGRKRTGFFDPWVAPVIAAVPPNEVAHFQCPMHDGILSEKSGVCPVCGMTLVPIQYGVRKVLHDAPYGLDFTAPSQGDAPLSRNLIFTPSKDGKLLRDLPIVHEHPMHLTIVSQDLSFFAHIHPVPQPDGSLAIPFQFPHPGNYILYAEYMPIGQRDQIFRFPLAVNVQELLSDADPPLEVTAGDAKPIAGYPELTAELICQPRTPTAGTHAMLMFRLTDRGQPVTDLESYMAAMGHCAIISQDTQMFLHCHPEQLYPTTPDSRGGPVIAFHTLFPKPGRYKIWAQFKRGGKIVVADFVIDVGNSFLPPNVVNFILND